MSSSLQSEGHDRTGRRLGDGRMRQGARFTCRKSKECERERRIDQRPRGAGAPRGPAADRAGAPARSCSRSHSWPSWAPMSTPAQGQRDFRLRRMLVAADVVRSGAGPGGLAGAARAPTAGSASCGGCWRSRHARAVQRLRPLRRRVCVASATRRSTTFPGSGARASGGRGGVCGSTSKLSPRAARVRARCSCSRSSRFVAARSSSASAVRHVGARMLGAERVLFVGSGPMTPILVRQILAGPRHGLEPVGALTQPENERWPLPVRGSGRPGRGRCRRRAARHRRRAGDRLGRGDGGRAPAGAHLPVPPARASRSARCRRCRP